MPLPVTDTRTIRELLEQRAAVTPDFIFGRHDNQKITFQELDTTVNRLANGLVKLGVAPGKRVAVMMDNHPEHVFVLFSLAKIGAIWIPVNSHLLGASLRYLIEKAVPQTLIVEAGYLDRFTPILNDRPMDRVIVRGSGNRNGMIDFSGIAEANASPPDTKPGIHEVRAVFFTSGTTGPPKGAFLTERMIKTCAVCAAMASDAVAGDRYLLWEPIYHTSGAQMCVMALMEPVMLAIVPRFSASLFWDQVRSYRITKMHYLGGILDILMKAPPNPDDRRHHVRIAFGAGCNPDTWFRFEERFGVEVREVYGMTEGSGFSTLNNTGKIGSIGKPYPFFEVRVVGPDNRLLEAGEVGEIIIRGKVPGLIMQGYLDDPKATSNALRAGWLHTGDLGRFDEDGDFYFVGRMKECIRRRGENISAWEVERVLNSHPGIEESAVIGVKADIGEQEIKAFIKCAGGSTLVWKDFVLWCRSNMPVYQIPRYVSFVEKFEKTPTERIRKRKLPATTADCWDLAHLKPIVGLG